MLLDVVLDFRVARWALAAVEVIGDEQDHPLLLLSATVRGLIGGLKRHVLLPRLATYGSLGPTELQPYDASWRIAVGQLAQLPLGRRRPLLACIPR